MENYKEDHIGILDGVRGLMALWVFIYHLMAASIGKFPFWGSGAMAVDVFMILSGFLMTYHWEIRRDKFGDFRSQLSDFYTRRFFRIAPLYYCLLFVAFLGHDYFYATKNFVEGVMPPPWAAELKGLHIHHGPTNIIINVVSHYTFLFGLFPQYAASNVLPDWSIGLEMQFYLVFPFLMLMLTRFGSFSTVVLLAAVAFISKRLFVAAYPQPSLILFKINIFVAGICIAFAYFNKNKVQCIPWLILSFLSIARSPIQIKILAFAIIFMLLFDPKRNDLLHRSLSGSFAKFLGDTSYSVYLLHFMIMFPILNILFHYQWFRGLSSCPRLSISFIIISVPVYGLSYLLFRTIELPGIKFGKYFCKKTKLATSV